MRKIKIPELTPEQRAALLRKAEAAANKTSDTLNAWAFGYLPLLAIFAAAIVSLGGCTAAPRSDWQHDRAEAASRTLFAAVGSPAIGGAQ